MLHVLSQVRHTIQTSLKNLTSVGSYIAIIILVNGIGITNIIDESTYNISMYLFHTMALLMLLIGSLIPILTPSSTPLSSHIVIGYSYCLCSLPILLVSLVYSELSAIHLLISFTGLLLASTLFIIISRALIQISPSPLTQIILSLTVNFILWGSGWIPISIPLFSFIMNQLSMAYHFQPFIQGLLHSTHVGYFLIMMTLFIFIKKRSFE